MKDIGSLELLNVMPDIDDRYACGWHNAIEYCVKKLREAETIIPATEEKSCETCEHGFLSIAPPYCCRLDWKEYRNCIESMKHWTPKKIATEEGE